MKAMNWYIKRLKNVARSLTLIKKIILSKMRDKENKSSMRKFTDPFYYRLLDGITWNSSELLIMHHCTIITAYLPIDFRHFYYTRWLRSGYGTNTWRLRNGLKNHRNELLNTAASKITCVLYYTMWERIWIIKRSYLKRVRKESVYGLVYVA
jgi:hypothetical protein